ncbi:Agamous-like MADS-box protein AGL97 [Cardamine amara subsp. amara]|uniref:Agamous-like MADS-box protein AGL97 n=1 Tax=Cardamine amara subsp. amara TaxID=228776 RepID=A0ABD1ASE6_CARAN
MRGIKRKIPLEKIEKKDSRAVAFSKRSKGLYSKAADLCLLSGGKIAIIATPVSSNSNVSFYSFGHSSVDSVVSAFLANKHPREDDDLGFWWNDEGLARSKNPEELREAMNSMSQMLQHLKDMEKRGEHEDVEKKGNLHVTHQKQTLDLQSSSTSANFQGFNKNSEDQFLAISDNNNKSVLTGNLDYVITHQKQTLDLQSSSTSANFEGFNKNSEDQFLAISDNNNNSGLTGNLGGIGANQELGLDQIFDIVKSQGPLMNLETDDVSLVTRNQNPLSDSEAVEELVMQNRDLYENNLVNLSDIDENQILSISDNNNNNDLSGNNEGWFDQELDLDQIIDFEAFEDGGSDPIDFSGFFNELASITAL